MKNFSKPNPNILLTERCNQSCDYCFAKKKMEMAEKKEMNFDNLKRIVRFLKDNKQSEIRLMGGEPTLHRQFKEIVDHILSQKLKILLFTNGLFPQELAGWLGQKGDPISYLVNLLTPAVETEEGKSLIACNLNFLKDSKIQASITVGSLEFKIFPIIEFIKDNGIKSVRFGISNRPIGDKNFLPIERYRDFGSLIHSFVERLKEETGVGVISFDCGFTPCMFEQKQVNYFLKGNVRINGWGCAGKWGSFDISADLDIFPCFVLDDVGRRNVFSFRDLGAVNKFIKNLLKYTFYKASLFGFEACKKCFYYKNSTCRGPCLGYVVNNFNNQEFFRRFLNAPGYKIIDRLLYIFRNWA